jgi:hypothetical protein
LLRRWLVVSMVCSWVCLLMVIKWNFIVV